MISMLKYMFSHKDNLKGQAKTGSVWVSLSKLGINVLNFLVVLILMRYFLGPEEFGLVQIAILFSEIVNLFTLQGISDTLIYIDEDSRKIDSLFYLIIFLGFLAFLAFFFGASTISGFYKLDLGLIFKLMSVNFFVIAAGATPMALLRKRMQLREESIIQFVSQIVAAVSTLVLAVFKFGVYAIIGGMCLKYLAILIMGFLASGYRPRWFFSIRIIKSLFAYIKFVTGEALVMFVLNRSDQFIVSKFFSAAIFGFYSQAFNFINYPLSISRMTFHTVLFSVFSKVQEDLEEMRRMFVVVNRHIATLFIPLFMGFGAVADLFVSGVLGEQWEPCVPYIYIFTVFALIKIVGVTLPQTIKSIGKPQHLFYYNLVRMIVLIPALLASTLLHQPIWTAIIMVGIMLIFKPVEWVMLKRTVGIEVREYLSIFFIPLSASVVMALGIFWIKRVCAGCHSILLLAITILCGMILYTGVSFLLDRQGSKRFLYFIRSYVKPE